MPVITKENSTVERGTPSPAEVRERARGVLEAAWDEYRGYCFPNRDVYGHQWLWDSCFHVVAWAEFADARAWRELASVFAAQLPVGMVPHMRYSEPTHARGPLTHCSSYTQPPLFALAACSLADAGFPLSGPLLAHIEAGLAYLWERRRTTGGLIKLVHPWEAGADDSPRWDAWIGHSDWNRPEWTGLDLDLVQSTEFGAGGDAIGNSRFEVAPAAFNAITSHAMTALHLLTGDSVWQARAGELAAAIDELLWDDEEEMWADLSLVGPSDTSRIPTLDGILGALSTNDEDKADRALRQLARRDRFAAPYGLAYVARSHPTFRGDLYWRGAAWPQMNHLARLAAARWGREDLEQAIAAMSRRGAVASGFSELWDPDTGEPRGAVPQTWSALAAVDRIHRPCSIA